MKAICYLRGICWQTKVDRKKKEEAHVRSRFGDDAPKAVSESGHVQEVDRHLLPRPAYLDKITSLLQHASAKLQKNAAPTAPRKSYYSSPFEVNLNFQTISNDLYS